MDLFLRFNFLMVVLFKIVLIQIKIFNKQIQLQVIIQIIIFIKIYNIRIKTINNKTIITNKNNNNNKKLIIHKIQLLQMKIVQMIHFNKLVKKENQSLLKFWNNKQRNLQKQKKIKEYFMSQTHLKEKYFIKFVKDMVQQDQMCKNQKMEKETFKYKKQKLQLYLKQKWKICLFNYKKIIKMMNKIIIKNINKPNKQQKYQISKTKITKNNQSKMMNNISNNNNLNKKQIIMGNKIYNQMKIIMNKNYNKKKKENNTIIKK
ncbi:hypothetical protein IMG5_169100 [Ichthyophthirius multifiliis]|uniref:Transmembrane protein n=1 Tax=Ichthyophthirius multifiliis TaxID=5932 RepID=G0R189_ICHMU|nr:hypothetical protein IMG5_169100 [Ichthyophthirius multifiliis]EGR28774.1 hypothetical protein IMG5_169100 [Ichthyophthirius multifiliis]|eukprot:XP_004030010.1 hypothetical protein IMG5_169100 [Ichthyophthirius multifiliis]